MVPQHDYSIGSRRDGIQIHEQQSILQFHIVTLRRATPPNFSHLQTLCYRSWRARLTSHLGLDIFEQGLELVHVRLLLGPANAKSLDLVGLGDLEEVSGLGRGFDRGFLRVFTMWKWTCMCVSTCMTNGFPRGEGREAYMLDDLVGSRAVVLEDVVLGGAGGLDELLDDGL